MVLGSSFFFLTFFATGFSFGASAAGTTVSASFAGFSSTTGTGSATSISLGHLPVKLFFCRLLASGEADLFQEKGRRFSSRLNCNCIVLEPLGFWVMRISRLKVGVTIGDFSQKLCGVPRFWDRSLTINRCTLVRS